MHEVEYWIYDEDCDKKSVMDDINEYAEKCGDGYYGPVHWHDNVEPLENIGKAKQWITEHDKGWYDDHAVMFYDCVEDAKTKVADDLKRRIKENLDKSAEYEKAHSVLKHKAEFIGCPKCMSKLARKHLKYEKCPVCYADLRSKTTLDTLTRYEEKRQELYRKLEKENEKHGKRVVKWLVKFEYHC